MMETWKAKDVRVMETRLVMMDTWKAKDVEVLETWRW